MDELKTQILIAVINLLTAVIALIAAIVQLIGPKNTDKPTTTNADQSKRGSEPPSKGD